MAIGLPGVIDINDPFMTLTASILGMLPRQLRGGLIVRRIRYQGATVFCVINLDFVFEIERLNRYTESISSSGDLISAYVSSPA
jgi:hypothetical protein